jgi:hypothetical protein
MDEVSRENERSTASPVQERCLYIRTGDEDRPMGLLADVSPSEWIIEKQGSTVR